MSAAGFEIPHGEGHASPQPESRANVIEATPEHCAIPLGGSQIHVGVRTAAVAVFVPVLTRERGEIEHAATQPREVADGTTGGWPIEVLHDVVAHHEIEGLRCAVVLNETMVPAVALAKILARFDTRVGRARKDSLERCAQHASAASHIENALHRHSDVFRMSGDESPAIARFG